MKKQIITIMLGILILASVVAMYPGETKIFNNDMGIENLVYTIIGNSSPVNIIVEVNSTNITITFPQDMTPDNFQIVFIENQTKEIVQTITNTIHTGGGGGGSSRTKYIYQNVTKPIPIYTDVEVIKEVPTEVEKIVYKDSKFIWWPIIVSLIVGAIIMLVIIYFLKEMTKKLKTKDEEK